jgi:VIT1/CCC1 family predicted Fe2+/Mn2+ transporter
MNQQSMDTVLAAQRNEITEYYVYMALARRQKDPANRAVLERIAQDERRHAGFWANRTGITVGPKRLAVWWYAFVARAFGLTFAVKLMERGEEGAQKNYNTLAGSVQEAESIAQDESEHEKQLLAMLDEERLRYVGSVVLGLSDALVELTGALAGFTLALAETRLIAMVGLITGIAAAMSMAASEYLSTKAEPGEGKTPVKAAVYTGTTYIVTVALLIIPYLAAPGPLVALGLTLAIALVLILAFTYYVAVAKDLPLWSRFAEMAGITLAVAAASFTIGYAVRIFFGIDA